MNSIINIIIKITTLLSALDKLLPILKKLHVKIRNWGKQPKQLLNDKTKKGNENGSSKT